MARRGREHRSTGSTGFLLGTAMGLVTNLLTNDAGSWPQPLRFLSQYSWVLALAIVLGVCVNASYQWWRRRVRRPRWTGDNPYPGLLPYESERRAVFFGRGAETRELIDRVHDATEVTRRFVPVVGPSGSGKSSVVLAGLVPVVARRATVVGPFVPGGDGVGELARALAHVEPPVDQVSLTEALRADARAALIAARASQDLAPPGALVERVDRIRRGHRTVIVIDQLEELATLGTEEERQAFLALLEAALRHDRRLIAVGTLRSEFLGQFQHGPGSVLVRQPVLVNVLDARALQQVIVEPAEMSDTTFDDGLVAEMVAEAGGGDALPMLSYLLSVLYAEYGRDGHLSRADYQAAGGVAGVIARRADAVLSALTADPGANPVEILDLLLGFVSLDGTDPTRRRVDRRDLTDAQRVVADRFVAAHLLVSDCPPGTDGVQLSLAHEALLRQWPPLRDRIAARADWLRCRSELEPLAQAWLRVGRRPDYLITGPRLREARQILDGRAGIPQLLAEFLDTAERDERHSRAEVAANAALTALGRDPETAILLATAAGTELAATESVRWAWHAALATGLRAVLRHTAPVISVAWSPDGRLAVACDDGRVRIWRRDGEPAGTLGGHTERVMSVAWAGDGRLATASLDGTARIWSTTGGLVRTIPGHTGWVTSVAWSPEGRLATASADGTVGVWSEAERAGRTFGAHAERVTSLAWSGDGRLATVSLDFTARIWSATGEPLRTIPGHTGWVTSVAWAPSGRLATASKDGTVRIWNATGGLVRTLSHSGPVPSVAWSPDGRLATAEDRQVRIWSGAGEPLHTVTGHSERVVSVAWAADGRLATACEDGTARIWELVDESMHTLTGHADSVAATAWAPDGRLATASADRSVRIWTPDGQLLHRLTGHSQRVVGVAWGPDGQLATASHDKTVRIWSRAGEPLQVVAAHTEPVAAVAWASDGRLATGSADRTARIRASNGELLHTLTGHTGWVMSVAWASDGRLATGSADRTALIWAANGLPLHILTGHTERVAGVAWAADGRLATASHDKTVRIWAPNGELLDTITGHGEPVTAVAWAPDGRLATASADRTVRIWTSQGKLLQTLTGHRRGVMSVAWAADGRLATASDDGTGRIWRAPHQADVLAGVAASCRLRRLTDQERQAAHLAAE